MNFYYRTHADAALIQCKTKKEAMETAQIAVMRSYAANPFAEVFRGTSAETAVLILRYERVGIQELLEGQSDDRNRSPERASTHPSVGNGVVG